MSFVTAPTNFVIIIIEFALRYKHAALSRSCLFTIVNAIFRCKLHFASSVRSRIQLALCKYEISMMIGILSGFSTTIMRIINKLHTSEIACLHRPGHRAPRYRSVFRRDRKWTRGVVERRLSFQKKTTFSCSFISVIERWHRELMTFFAECDEESDEMGMSHLPF